MTVQKKHAPSRRKFLHLAAGAAGAGIVARAMPVRAQAMKVRVGYIGDFHGTSITAVANKLDLWKKYKLDADIKGFTNGPIQIQALGAGDLDFGYIGPGALWLPMTGKAKIIAMNVVGFSDRVIGQPNIKKMEDLRGKTVAVPEGTSGDMLLRLALAKAGMKLDDVKRLTMDPSTVVTAFASGQVDGAGIWYPHVATLKSRIPNLNELFSNEDALPANSFPSCFVMRNELADPKNAALVDAFVRVVKEANDYRKGHVEQAVEWTAAMLGAPKANLEAESKLAKYYSSAELAQLSDNGTVQSWLKGMNDMFKTFNRVPESVDPNSYYLGKRYASVK
ncbi:MAG: aliphatic sulfonate ABC transporter substrate-binding protein [Alphaproteobacteria bacterium]|nr:aliphatic sulfonate ABC transporter substrate-binding protein [Alphaproteobacteria bacterium]